MTSQLLLQSSKCFCPTQHTVHTLTASPVAVPNNPFPQSSTFVGDKWTGVAAVAGTAALGRPRLGGDNWKIQSQLLSGGGVGI